MQNIKKFSKILTVALAVILAVIPAVTVKAAAGDEERVVIKVTEKKIADEKSSIRTVKESIKEKQEELENAKATAKQFESWSLNMKAVTSDLIIEKSNLLTRLKEQKVLARVGIPIFQIIEKTPAEEVLEDIEKRKELVEITEDGKEVKLKNEPGFLEVLSSKLSNEEEKTKLIDRVILIDYQLNNFLPEYEESINKSLEQDEKVKDIEEDLKKSKKKLAKKEEILKKHQEKLKKAVKDLEVALEKEKQRLAAFTELKKPVNSQWISSYFGYRSNPFTDKGREFHSGIDWPAPLNTPIKAAGSGIITKARKNGGYGNFIEIRHTDNMVTRYGHLNSYNVVEGQEVSRGDIIGYMGTTGRSTGSHLHFEVKINGKVQNPLNFVNN